MSEQDDSADEISLSFLKPSPLPGALGRLDRYEILEVIGRGAFGTVLRAFDDKLQRVLAIKVMSPELAVTSPARKRYFGDDGQGNGEGATSFGDSGGPVFLHATNEIVALTSLGLNFQATGPGFAYRVDSVEAQEFIASALAVGNALLE